MKERVTSLHLWVRERFVTVVCAYRQNGSGEYPSLLDSDTLRGVIGRNTLPDPYPSGVLFLDLCGSHSLHKHVYQCTWHKDTLGWRSMIHWVVVLS